MDSKNKDMIKFEIENFTCTDLTDIISCLECAINTLRRVNCLFDDGYNFRSKFEEVVCSLDYLVDFLEYMK